MKRLLSNLFIISIVLTNSFSFVIAEGNKNYFIVTAYYSPLPNQNYYLKGNYEDELKLNGNGIAGASGKEVFDGMFAAPSNYKFGTKIYLEGIGIGSVEDRGGAIVNAGKRGYEYDRIDVWMGYGDEGLRRALYWGKRKVLGNVIAKNSDITVNIYNIPSPMWVTQNLKKIPNIFNIGIGKDSNKEIVYKLQKFLKEINIYNGELDGIYNSKIIDLIYNFQINNNILKIGDLYGAGYWGNTTRNLFLEMYLDGDFDNKDNIINIVNKKSINEVIILNEIDKNNNTDIFNNFTKNKEDVIKLQNIFKELSLYEGELTGEYNDLIDCIFDFQISEGILNYSYDAGAGNYGPKTRNALKNYYELYKDKKEELRREELRLQEEKIFEEKRQKELEEKFKKLDEMADKQAEEKVSIIGEPKFGEISQNVRELQLLLKELGYFEYKDTAIFGNITKESILLFQIDNNLVGNENDLGAGMIGPVTKSKMKEVIKNNIIEELIINENLNKDELVNIGIYNI